MSDSTSQQLLFAKKVDIITSLAEVYECLIDITQELERLHDILRGVERTQCELSKHVSHIRSIVSKDLIIRGQSPHMTTNLRDLKMSQNQWREYINSAASPASGRQSDTASETSSTRGNRVRKNVDDSEKDVHPAEIVNFVSAQDIPG